MSEPYWIAVLKSVSEHMVKTMQMMLLKKIRRDKAVDTERNDGSRRIRSDENAFMLWFQARSPERAESVEML